MARHFFGGSTRDSSTGQIRPSSTITVYLAGTLTLASVYAASTGGTAVSSVLSDSDGKFGFWVDEADYALTQLFDLVSSKTGFTSITYQNVPAFNLTAVDTDGTMAANSDKKIPTQKAVVTYVSTNYQPLASNLTTLAGLASVANLSTVAGYASVANLGALAGLTGVADYVPYFTGAGAMSTTSLTSAARTVLDDATVGDMLATLGGIASSLFDANTILKADSDNTPLALTVDEQRIVGRKTGGSITSLTGAEVESIIGISNPVSGIYRNLTVANNSSHSDHQLDISIDEITVISSGLNTMRLCSFSKTVDITASGANGLDTGSEASSTWYYIYAIAKDDGTMASILSTNSTNPSLPSGYTYWARIGAIYNNGSSNFISIKQVDNNVVRSSVVVVNGSAASSYTAASLAAVVPATAKKCTGTFGTYYSSGTGTYSTIASTDTGLGGLTVFASGATGIRVDAPFTLPLVVAQTLYYCGGNASVANYLSVSGWEF